MLAKFYCLTYPKKQIENSFCLKCTIETGKIDANSKTMKALAASQGTTTTTTGNE